MQLNKVIIAPDSFKGSLSAKQAADIIADEVHKAIPDCEIVKIPIADGGEGSVDTILSAIGGELFAERVQSPDDREIKAMYGISDKGAAIIEMAQSSGITKQKGLHPMTSSTFGFGQLILDALERSARQFILCIGGSATTDGGCGMAAALGAEFFDERGSSFVPCGGTLSKIAEIGMSRFDERVALSKFTVMCDVGNPLFGTTGAAYVFSPQKGANPEQAELLDKGLRNLGALFSRHFGRDYANAAGAGAAGGLGAGCMAFLGAELMSGIDTILHLCGFEEHIRDADLIITGEGKLDAQSFDGKVLTGILSKSDGIPVWSVCGENECDEQMLSKYNVTAIEMSKDVSSEECMSNPERYLRNAAKRALSGCDTSNH